MVNYYIYAKDYSGSTNGVKFYHSKGLETLEQFKCDVEKIKDELLRAGEPPSESRVIYLHWNNHCVEVNEEQTITSYEQLHSDWLGTQPETIIHFLKENCIFNDNDRIKLLYIITDGMIHEMNTRECFKYNEDMHYETVVFHAFNENLNQIDLSVAASFFKGRSMVYRNFQLFDCTDISKEFNYDKINIDNFVEEKEDLKSYIKLKFIGKLKQDAKALREIDKLKKLRDRLFRELTSKTDTNKLKVNLDTKDKNVFLSEFVKTDWYKSLNAPVYSVKVDIEKSIATLINYIVSDSKSYSFDALKFDTKYDKSAETEQMTDDLDFKNEEEIEFPDVILTEDKGIPVVLLTDFKLMDKIIFHRTPSSNEVTPASFSKFKSTMECPLFLVNDKDISGSIGYFYTLNVYKQLLANDVKTDPRTRKPFHGGIVLTSTDQFDKYNDYIISATYFDCKKINYNVGLFYYVLWKNCENKEWMDKNVVEHFKKYAMRRISETVCKIGLSSLPLDPPENTSLLSALWYCVELSSYIFKNDPQNFQHERLRMFHGVARYMIEILKHFQYDLDHESISKRRELISNVMILKRIPKQREKIYYFLENIFKTEEGFLISEIEKPFNIYKLNYLKYDHRNILRDEVVDEVVHLSNYVHFLHYVGDLEASKAGKGTFEICEKTFRPYFVIDRNTSFYEELVKSTRKVVIKNDGDNDKIEVAYEPIDKLEFDRILSLYKLFIDCVKDLEKYPTLVEYIEFIQKRKKFHEDIVTIFPPNVYLDIENVYDNYQKIVNNVSVEEFIKACESCVNRFARIKEEERVKFRDDNEISEFIASQESKVRLKKKT
ncbi:uncharacterized protein LOC119838829 [Zerene cesonia]|uniref:uncharacterized protein LOC119838829 n=1 Tax=Zerene cesonia TaxID=33412 RepID=UPI0018E5579B|nr:uncharacterized protein LOC119838829 [Zerene cesonia]